MEIIIWPVNGFLAVIYTAFEHFALIVTAFSCALLILRAPREQRAWISLFLLPSLLASSFVPSPVPVILSMMSLAGAIFVRLDRFNPEALRWRVVTGIALYSLASLAFSFYLSYTSRLSPLAWAKLVGSIEEAASLIASGRSFLHTLGIWGLWLIIPLGYFSLLLQGFLAHPPVPLRPEEVVRRIRQRKEEEEEEEWI
ncbi:MAG: hypothetical protein QW687_00845 [Candidatus Hadarchaeales archaeon]